MPTLEKMLIGPERSDVTRPISTHICLIRETSVERDDIFHALCGCRWDVACMGSFKVVTLVKRGS